MMLTVILLFWSTKIQYKYSLLPFANPILHLFTTHPYSFKPPFPHSNTFKMQLKLSALTAVLAAASSVIAAPAPPSGPSAKDVSYALDKITELSNNLDTKLKDLQGPIAIGQVRTHNKILFSKYELT